MKRRTSWLLVAGILASSFGGGALSHWLLSGTGTAQAQEAGRAPKIVTAQQFRVVDAAGKVVAILGLSEKDTGLHLFDDSGAMRASIRLAPHSAPAFTQYDEKGKVRLALCLGEKDGTPRLYHHDQDEKIRMALVQTPDGGFGLSMYDAAGKTRSVVGLGPDGNPLLTQQDAKGTARALLVPTAKGAWALTLSDEDGKPVAQLP